MASGDRRCGLEGEGRLGEVGLEELLLSPLDMMLAVMTGPEDGVFSSFWG